jgi:hypothetical protein
MYAVTNDLMDDFYYELALALRRILALEATDGQEERAAGD